MYKKLIPIINVLFLLICSCSFVKANEATIDDITKLHGNLSVNNGKLVNQHNHAISLVGPSLFWSNNGYEGEQYYNEQSIAAFKNDWHATVIRAAMAAQGKGSYLTNPEDNLAKVERVINAAIKHNLYVIVDWHSHHAEENEAQAIAFFTKIAQKYGDLPNIIYEIYNEPLKETDWDTVVKPYSETLINAIRLIDPDNIILVGTQSWSQDVDKAAKNPIKNQINIMYTLHFYAGTHKQSLRDKAITALNAGLALFVSEWGTVNADGDGDIDKQSTEDWLNFMREHELSHCSWSVSNKAEGAAFIKPGVKNLGPWPDEELTSNGLYLKSIIQNWYINQ